MRATLARVLLVIAATAATVVTTATAAPAAHAATSDVIFGGCSYSADAQATVTGPDTYVGVVHDASATVDSAGTPIAATVSCQIQVNDVAAPGATFSYSGLGVQAGANPVSFTAAPTDVVDLCQRVVYADLTDTGWVCPGVDQCFVNAPCFPPTVTALLDLVNAAITQHIDPALCPVLAANAGGYGAITIAPDGDLYVSDPLGLGLNPIYDCPPYGNF